MNIGIMISSLEAGGLFQYALSIADSLIRYSNKFNYKIIYSDTKSLNWSIHNNPSKMNYIFLPFSKSSVIDKFKLVLNSVLNRNILNAQKSGEISRLERNNVDFLIIPGPSLFGFRNKIPYIVSIPDLMHRYYPSFPEYSLKEYLMRNIVYKNVAYYSSLTIVDSTRGRDDLYKFFKIPKEKVRVIPYIPPGYIYEYKDIDIQTGASISEKYNLPDRFLFYPAQFWYHKNHLRLIRALEHIKQVYKLKIPLVLVGFPKGNYKKIMDSIKKSSVSNQIFHLGYISDKEIVALYKKAVALVFPSLFGPTNIPPLEAMVLGAPVVCSNLFSMPEQVGDAGLLFDPYDIEDMAEKIYSIWIDENLRKELILKGYERVKHLTLENHARQWEKVIEEALEK